VSEPLTATDTRLRELVLAEADKHRDAHGESCDCDLGLVLGDLSDAALADLDANVEEMP